MANFYDIEKCTFRATQEFPSFNIINVEVATTGYCGGDSGHGGRTFLTLKDLGGTDFDVRKTKDEFGNESIEIMLAGDSELQTFIESLRWAANTLEKMAEAKEWLNK